MRNKKIIITGGAGFIGSNVAGVLNRLGRKDLIIVDHLREDKKPNLEIFEYERYLDKDEFIDKIKTGSIPEAEVVIHLGARTDTTETDRGFIIKNNTEYSQTLFTYCARKGIRFIYASSASVYGDGLKGYDEEEWDLKPLNYYAESKFLFDKWVIKQQNVPPQWIGLRFFNVYGPNEYHKGKMASVIYHSFNQINLDGAAKLFKSNKPDYKDGEQKRDFIYVKDTAKVINFFLDSPDKNGIYNLGTGRARTFYDLAKATFSALGREPNIDFVNMPENLKDKYQYFTQAEMAKLRGAGYTQPFYELEDGIYDYVQNYLINRKT
ncbi:MAG: ADP-glyceromanno-heptose 6-epimerase [Candidatus Azambacteria bacterium GW2011_GWB1_42_17]|uniref:ADP-L-glycero-D-manno-heptose-6-epimerase n=1 Tax=Candidatus Azambacteria bacterium GW2011_GWB1_42_17 TaxID=1618615 RepID=A0A0G1C573_9BACT|nr:MAG: ADP-glyceromanno-heptose 6-epimerase [Candidatus Azambacteria bacterium GW2011_GWB1_42_17]